MLIKREKGFTLIELLAVIVILAIIMAIVTPIILKSINTAKKGAFKNSVYGIIKAAEYRYSLQIIKDDNIETMVFQYLDGVETSTPYDNKLEYKGTLPQNGTVIINEKGAIALALHDGKYCIEKDFTSDDLIITEKNFEDCDLEIQLVDMGDKNSPKLLDGMTPIKWNGFTEITTTADDEDWYDYENKKWANAKTADGSYWVWIPRYAYRIITGFHYTTSNPEIEIKFLSGTTNDPLDDTPIEISGYNGATKNTSNNYFLHPAFKFGDENISGFWVAKFEPSMSSNKIRVVPNELPYTEGNLSEFYDLGLNMKTYICNGTCGTGTDTHMAKNTEWGAVAYLSQSIYGAKAEVYKNNTGSYQSLVYTTGCAGNEAKSDMLSECQNEWDTNGGVMASTTHNITGVYDMSGGTWESVAAYVNNGSISLTTNGQSILDANNKYKDIYSVASSDTDQNNYLETVNRYGDAIWETSVSGKNHDETSWYGAYSYYACEDDPWLIRGGYAGTIAGSGVFNFFYDNGEGGTGGGLSNTSFRPIALLP